MELVAGGNYGEADLISLAGRLGRLVKYVETPEDVEALRRLTGGTLPELAEGLLNAFDYDLQLARAQAISGQADPPTSALAEAELQLALEATQPFKSQELRDLVLEIRRREKQAIDDLSQDKILFQGFDEDQARWEIISFRALLEQETNKKQIELFELALNRPIGVPLTQGIQGVARNIQLPLTNLKASDIERVWRAYQRLETSRVQGAGTKRTLTDIIALIRYTIEREADELVILEPFQETVNRRFAQWLAEQQRQRSFTRLQLWWLERIRDRVATDLQCQPDGLSGGLGFDEGGLTGAIKEFGGEQELATILRELNEKLLERRIA